MTMDDIEAMKDDWITPATAASAMKMNTGRLIAYAKAGQLPFPVQISGNRVKISRKGFLKAYGHGEPEEKHPAVEELLQKLIEELHSVTIAITLLADPDRVARVVSVIDGMEGGPKQ